MAQTDLPKLAAPAQRALANAGIQNLKQLSKFSEAEIKQLHGIGPNALTQLRRALKAKDFRFANDAITQKRRASMSEREHLAYVIENHFSNPDSNVGGTFAPFVTVTDGLTAAQAAQSPGERLNSVWAIVNHIAFWQEVTRLGALGQRIVVSDWGLQEMGNGWPPLGEISEANWRAARQRALDGNKACAQAILSLSDEEFATRTDPSWGGLVSQAVLSIYGHNCYHTAEILSMRHALKWWANHPWA